MAGIFAFIFFAYLSRQVVLLFNTKVPTGEPIDSFETLVDALASQKYRLMLDDNYGADYGIQAWARMQSQGLFERVTRAFGKYPPWQTVNSSIDNTQELLIGADPFPVLITSSTLIPGYTVKFCGLAMVHDDNRIAESDTLFMRKGLPGVKRITAAHRALIRVEYERLMGINRTVKSCYRHGLESHYSYEPLELPQLQYVFALILVISGAGGMTLVILEWFSGRFSNRRYVWNPEEMGEWEKAKQVLQEVKQLVENFAEGNAEVAEHINAAISLLNA